MKKKVIIAIVVLLLVLSIGAFVAAGIVLHVREANEKKYFQELTLNELMEKVENKERFILVVSQTTCSHCAIYKPRIQKVLAENKIVGYYIEKNLLTDEEKNILDTVARVDGTPKTLLFENGEEGSIDTRIEGAESEKTIRSRLKMMGYIE